MTSAASWHTLNHEEPGVPLLLLRTDFTNDGYDVRLSDLSNVWSETLDRDGLCRRASELACSIDPNEDDDQYGILAKSISQALAQKAGSTVHLKHGRGNGLILSLTKTLPRPLAPLSWEVRLKHADQSQIKSELVQPLLNTVSRLKLQQQMLFAEIAAKDHVISRLTDRLETTGMPLAEIFPNVAGLSVARRHGISRDKLAQHVRGLGTFDSEAWALGHAEATEDKASPEDVARVLQSLPRSKSADERASNTSWWSDVDLEIQEPAQDNSLAEDSSRPSYSQKTTEHTAMVSSQLPAPSHLDDGDSSTDDELEVMISPPPKKKVNDITHVETAKQSVQSRESPTKRQLGGIGGRKRSPVETTHQPLKDDQEADLPKAKTKAKLGAIGGKAKAAALQSPEKDSAHSQSSKTLSDAPASPSPARPRSAFTIGGKKTQSMALSPPHRPAEDHQVREQTQEMPTASVPQPIAEDAPLEAKADAKRDALKRQLEQKAASTRKKRKF